MFLDLNQLRNHNQKVKTISFSHFSRIVSKIIIYYTLTLKIQSTINALILKIILFINSSISVFP